MNQTKARQLAERLSDQLHKEPELYREVISELRRLSPMEAERDKLIAVNKVLVELVKRYRTETPLGNQPHMITGEADEALKLAGEIK